MANTDKPTGPTRSVTAPKTAPDTEPKSEQAPADRVAELEAENDRLRTRLAQAGVSADDPRKPRPPKFGISEGTREELERRGEANDPFTGKRLTRADLP